MLESSNDEFITINNIELGEGSELINFPTDTEKCASVPILVGDCSPTDTFLPSPCRACVGGLWPPLDWGKIGPQCITVMAALLSKAVQSGPKWC